MIGMSIGAFAHSPKKPPSLKLFCAEMRLAFDRGDLKWFKSHTSDTFVQIDALGRKTSKAAALTALQETFARATSIRSITTCGSMRRSGKDWIHSDAVKTTIQTIDASGRSVKLLIASYTDSKFRIVKGAWVILEVRDRKNPDLKLNGIPFDPEAR